MVKVLNMFREFSMTNVSGYNKLSNLQKNIFDNTYKKHISSMNMDIRNNYSEDNIKHIEKDRSNNLKVYFKNGECFTYIQGGIWMKNLPMKGFFKIEN